MKISFTDQEYDQLVQILKDKRDDIWREEETEIVPKMLRKLEAAGNYSLSAIVHSKSKYLMFAQKEKEREQYQAGIDGLARAMREK